MLQQRGLKATFMRGGTSKGLYINENQLPKEISQRTRLILRLFGSPDIRQIDGIGGADMQTSKVCIMGPPSRPDADIDYTFGQVSIGLPNLSYDNNCGNLSPGAAVYAIREGFVRAADPMTTVRVHNTNTGKILVAYVPTINGEPVVDGDYEIAGVPGTGSKITMDYSETAGGATGKLLPFGSPVKRVHFETLGKEIDVSLVDIGNLSVFVRASDIGVKGNETPDDPFPVFRFFSELQHKVGTLAGLKSTGTLPFTAVVSPAQDYTAYRGPLIKAEEMDFCTRSVRGKNTIFTTDAMHKAYNGTVSVATAVAALIPGTVVNEVFSGDPDCGVVRLGHTSGVMEVEAKVDVSGSEVTIVNAKFSRTVRPIMDGLIYVPESFYTTL